MALNLSFFQSVLGKPGKPGKPVPRGWSVNDLKQLKLMAQQGMSLRTMSLKLGRSEGSIQAKLEAEHLVIPGAEATERTVGGLS